MKNYIGWHKSSRSTDREDCVEQGIAPETGTVGVRDTKAKGNGPILEFSPGAWAAFIGSVTTDDTFAGGVL